MTTTTDRAEWLQWRRSGIGASDVGAIMGLSPFASPWSIWAAKVLDIEQEENEVMEAGRWLEAAIGPWFADRTGLVVTGEQTMATHPEHRRHLATLDGEVMAPGEGLQPILGNLEIKTTGPGPEWDEIPRHINTQVNWQMHVTGATKTWVAVLMGRRLDIHEADRDDHLIARMVEAVDRFWTEHVVTGDAPEVDGSNATKAALAAVYPGEDPKSTIELIDAEGFLRQVDEIARAKAVEKDIKDISATLENDIRATMGDNQTAQIEGRTVATLKPQTRKSKCKACGDVRESAPFRVLRIK